MQDENKYKIISTLKKYLKTIERVKDEDLDVLLTEIKEFIYSQPFIKDEYENKIKKFHNLQKTSKFKNIVDDFISSVIDDYKRINIDLNLDFFTIEKLNQYCLFWYRIGDFCTQKTVKRTRIFDIDTLGDTYSALNLYFNSLN